MVCFLILLASVFVTVQSEPASGIYAPPGPVNEDNEPLDLEQEWFDRFWPCYDNGGWKGDFLTHSDVNMTLFESLGFHKSADGFRFATTEPSIGKKRIACDDACKTTPDCGGWMLKRRRKRFECFLMKAKSPLEPFNGDDMFRSCETCHKMGKFKGLKEISIEDFGELAWMLPKGWRAGLKKDVYIDPAVFNRSTSVEEQCYVAGNKCAELCEELNSQYRVEHDSDICVAWATHDPKNWHCHLYQPCMLLYENLGDKKTTDHKRSCTPEENCVVTGGSWFGIYLSPGEFRKLGLSLPDGFSVRASSSIQHETAPKTPAEALRKCDALCEELGETCGAWRVHVGSDWSDSGIFHCHVYRPLMEGEDIEYDSKYADPLAHGKIDPNYIGASGCTNQYVGTFEKNPNSSCENSGCGLDNSKMIRGRVVSGRVKADSACDCETYCLTADAQNGGWSYLESQKRCTCFRKHAQMAIGYGREVVGRFRRYIS